VTRNRKQWAHVRQFWYGGWMSACVFLPTEFSWWWCLLSSAILVWSQIETRSHLDAQDEEERRAALAPERR
jgi:hypothetical protein